MAGRTPEQAEAIRQQRIRESQLMEARAKRMVDTPSEYSYMAILRLQLRFRQHIRHAEIALHKAEYHKDTYKADKLRHRLNILAKWDIALDEPLTLKWGQHNETRALVHLAHRIIESCEPDEETAAWLTRYAAYMELRESMEQAEDSTERTG